LLFEDGLEGGNAVADGRGFFEVEFFGAGFHLSLEIGEEVGVFAFEELAYVGEDGFVFGF